MASQAKNSKNSARKGKSKSMRLYTRVIVGLLLLAAIVVLVAFLTNYKGFTDWQRIDTNLTIFGAVIVNIVVLSTVFYMILRNLFKLIYERKKPFSVVKLKTKLIIAFVALSLPSIAFHLFASGVTILVLENLTEGEFSQVLDTSKVVMEELEALENQLMRRRAGEILSYLPKNSEGYAGANWMAGYQPRFKGGIFVYDGKDQVIARWVGDQAVTAAWKYPPPQHFLAKDGIFWRERYQNRQVQRLLLPLPGSSLKVELLDIAATDLSEAKAILTRKQESSRVLSRDLAAVVLTFLIVMTLLIIFAATWIAFYLAKGIVTPIERLDDATRRVSEGELGYEVDVVNIGPLEDDFAGLVSSFNTMSRQLAEQNNQLVQTTDDLLHSHHEIGERNRLVELLLENIDAGIISLSQQGGVTALNRTAKRLLQPRLEAWHGRHHSVVFDREIAGLIDHMLDALRGGSQRQLTQNLTLTMARKPVVVEVTFMALENKDGKSEGTVVMLKDVSAMQRNQRALAWREVARRVAHEIKNPLTPIQLSAQRIRRRYLDKVDGDSEVLDQCTREIINQVSSLKKMVNEFNQFAKLPESKPVPDDINRVIKDVSSFYENGLPENVKLKLELAKSLPDFPLDREQMKRVFTNLIDNAAAAVNGGGTITIRTVHDKHTNSVHIDVMDDGAGVPAEIRPRMFEPYETTKEGGTGLGLTIVNQIVSDHNGYIRYSDRKPKGTTFSMEFRMR